MGARKQNLIQPLSWERPDPDYGNRKGYDPNFLALRIPAPKLSKALRKTATLGVLAYEHFSVLFHPERKFAFWTAANIDGASERRLGNRAADIWWTDKRDAKAYVAHQVNNTFYGKSGFERGHLVRRLDPAWGSNDEEAARGEADSFHFTNCTPQAPKLNKQWWAKVENHVLDTANARDQQISCWARATCLFRGCRPTPSGPTRSAGWLSSAPCSSAPRRTAAGSCTRR